MPVSATVIRQIAREFHLSRNTATVSVYERKAQALPKLGPYEVSLLECLVTDLQNPGESSVQPQCYLNDCSNEVFSR